MDDRLRRHVVYLKALMVSKSTGFLLPHLLFFSALLGDPWMTFNALCFFFAVGFFGAGVGTGHYFLKLLSVNALSNPGFPARVLFPLDFSVGEFTATNDVCE